MAQEGLRKLIRAAQLKCGQPENCPAIVHELMTGRVIREFDKEILDHLISIGLNKEVRELLKQMDDNGGSRAQLQMWPPDLQQLVKDIDRARVYVPARRGFVELLPGAITRSEIRAAGDYLIAHGEDAINRGQLLLRLARRARGIAA